MKTTAGKSGRLPGPVEANPSSGVETLLGAKAAPAGGPVATRKDGACGGSRCDGENLSHAVWRLAWPAVLTMLLQFVNGLVDMFFVGWLGPAAQAAVGMGGQVVMLLMAASMAVTTGAAAIVARHAGAGDREGAAQAAAQALGLTLLLSLFLGAGIWVGREPVLRAMQAAPEVLGPGTRYLAVTAVATPAYFLLLTLIAVFQGLGDMRTPLAIMTVVNGANIAGDAVLILGWGPFPALGVTGAALASSCSRAAGALLALLWLGRTGLWRAGQPSFRPRRAWMARLLKIGVPAAVQSLLRGLGGTTYTGLLARTPEGTAAVAALFIGLRAEGLGYMPGVAYGRAATTLVGQSLGAGRPERAERSGWLCAWQSMAIILVMSGLFFLLAPVIAGWFTRDARVAALAASYLRVNALGEPFLAFSIVLGGALQGAGDTRFAAVVSILTMWVIRLPLTHFLCFTLGYGATAAWWVMSATMAAQGVLIAAWFRRGGWKSIQV
jgi:putative MATE family efflux protein